MTDLALFRGRLPDNSTMRKDDQADSTHFRSSDRVVCMNGEWFFETREGLHGPFPTREATDMAVARYVQEMNYVTEAEKPPAQEFAVRSGRFSDYTSSDLELVDKPTPRPES